MLTPSLSHLGPSLDAHVTALRSRVAASAAVVEPPGAGDGEPRERRGQVSTEGEGGESRVARVNLWCGGGLVGKAPQFAAPPPPTSAPSPITHCTTVAPGTRVNRNLAHRRAPSAAPASPVSADASASSAAVSVSAGAIGVCEWVECRR